MSKTHQDRAPSAPAVVGSFRPSGRRFAVREHAQIGQREGGEQPSGRLLDPRLSGGTLQSSRRCSSFHLLPRRSLPVRLGASPPANAEARCAASPVRPHILPALSPARAEAAMSAATSARLATGPLPNMTCLRCDRLRSTGCRAKATRFLLPNSPGRSALNPHSAPAGRVYVSFAEAASTPVAWCAGAWNNGRSQGDGSWFSARNNPSIRLTLLPRTRVIGRVGRR